MTTFNFDREYLRNGSMYRKFEKYFRNYSPFHIRRRNFGELWSTNKKLLVAHINQPKWISFWRLHFGHYEVLRPKIFKRATDWPGLPSAPPPPPNGDGVPRIKFYCINLSFGLKFSVWAPITSMPVGILSSNFYSGNVNHVMNFGPQTKKLLRAYWHTRSPRTL